MSASEAPLRGGTGTPTQPPRIAVIGAGISGLAAAHRLLELSRQHDYPVELSIYEASQRAGGVIATEERDGFVIDHGPDSMLSDKPPGVGLCQRLDLQSRMLRTREEFRRTYVAHGGRLHPLPEGFLLMAPTRLAPLAMSGLFSNAGKLRMALDLVLPSRPRDDESLAGFVGRRLGKQALERVAQPLVGGIYTADPSKLSLAATMPRFLAMEREHGSIIRGLRAQARTSAATERASGARWSLFVGFDRGMQTMVDELVGRLPPGSLLLGRSVANIRRSGTGWEIEAGRSDRYDGVINALPAPVASRTVAELDPDLAEQLAGIAYASSVVVNLAYPREAIANPLDGFGFVVPHVEGRNIIACSFSSMKYHGRAPSGFALLRCFVGGALRAELAELDDDEITRLVRGELAELLGVSGEPILHTVARHPQTMPQYEVGHLARIDRIERRNTSWPCFELAGNAYHGVGIPDCIGSGETAADALFRDLVGRKIDRAA